jgi:hypothetical protein
MRYFKTQISNFKNVILHNTKCKYVHILLCILYCALTLQIKIYYFLSLVIIFYTGSKDLPHTISITIHIFTQHSSKEHVLFLCRCDTHKCLRENKWINTKPMCFCMKNKKIRPWQHYLLWLWKSCYCRIDMNSLFYFVT